jgi:hypothetical protein
MGAVSLSPENLDDLRVTALEISHPASRTTRSAARAFRKYEFPARDYFDLSPAVFTANTR